MNRQISIIDHVGNKAGMDYYSNSLANAFADKGYKVSIYSNFNVQNSSIQYKIYYKGHIKKDNLITKFFNFLKGTILSSFSAKKENSDFVILHLFSTNLITLLLVLIPKVFGLKTVVISHDVSSFIKNDNKLFQNLIYNLLSNYIVVHNQFSYNELLQNIHIKNKDKVHIIKHGGYLDYISGNIDKVKSRESLGLDKNGKYLLFFGQIKDVKGLDILLKAMPKIDKDIKLIIAGKPWKADFNQYDELIDRYKVSSRVIKIIRFIEDYEREKLFFASDLNVLPYRIIYQSGVLLMAMSHGLPVLASNLPANREIILNNHNGMLFESENYNELASKVNLFFNDKSLQKLIKVNAKKTIEEKYNWNEIAEQYIKMINYKGE